MIDPQSGQLGASAPRFDRALVLWVPSPLLPDGTRAADLWQGLRGQYQQLAAYAQPSLPPAAELEEILAR